MTNTRHVPVYKKSCFQICLNEGDIVLLRLPGGDPSDPRMEFPIESVPRVFEVSCSTLPHGTHVGFVFSKRPMSGGW